jgi:hypothetical protein
MSADSLDVVTTARRITDSHFVLEVPDGYQQGRGAFGGLTLAAIVRAVDSVHGGPERAVRTLTAELCGPVLPGPAEITIEPLRLGSGTSTVAARITQQGELRTHAVLVLGRERARDVEHQGIVTPRLPDWRELSAIADGVLPPPFAQHFEFRPNGHAPFAGGGEARAAGFIRPRRPGPLRDAAFVTALADAWWPALFPIMSAPRPMATITFTLDLVSSPEGLEPEVPYYHEAQTLVSHAGFAPELRTLWGHDGRLLAINHQTFVIVA